MDGCARCVRAYRSCREEHLRVTEQIAETEKEAGEIGEALKRTTRGGVVEKNLQADYAGFVPSRLKGREPE